MPNPLILSHARLTTMPVIRVVDPQGSDALALLREAAIEARALYPELHEGEPRWPTNPPTPSGGIYLIAYADGVALGCGALRPLDADSAEVRRMYVLRSARRSGLARAILRALEDAARGLRYRRLRLETGVRQSAAIALYQASGFAAIEPFGAYVDDPWSVCFEKELSARAAGGLTE